MVQVTLPLLQPSYVDGKIQVIEASEYQRPNFTDMIQKIWELKQRYGHVSNIYVDAANPEVWQALKREFERTYDDQYVRDQIAECRKYNLHLEDSMFVCPDGILYQGCRNVGPRQMDYGRDRGRR